MTFRESIPVVTALLWLLCLAPPASAHTSDEKQEENVLEPAQDENGQNDARREAETSFGRELMLLQPSSMWSGYGDVIFESTPDAPSTFDSTHFNPILSTRFGDRFTAELELEIERQSIRTEYAFFDLSISPRLMLRVGRFLVPIGRFNEILHPSFRWPMVSRPLMFKDVVPAVWSDVGAQLRANVLAGKGWSLDCDAYVVNGLGGETAPPATTGTTETTYVRDLRSSLADNNDDKAAGAHLGLRLFSGRRVGATMLGVSAYSGAVDAAASRRLSIVDFDFSLALGDFSLSGELARSYLGTDRNPLVDFESGEYLRVSYRWEQIEANLRWDHLRARRDDGSSASRQQAVAGARYSASTFWSLRAELSHPLSSDAGPSLAAMLAFAF